MEFIDADAHFGGPVAEAARMSATKQGSAQAVTSLVRDSANVVDAVSLLEIADGFATASRTANLRFGHRHDTVIRSFVAALATKPFAILTGLSGSGKTQLAMQFGKWIGDVKVVAVRPDWTNPDALLGFENVLSERDADGRYQWNVPETLEFILNARDEPSRPHLLVLDEMNLAHVERYFADVLSGMESSMPVIPNLSRGEDGAYRQLAVGESMFPLPQNLFVIGTVNIDETTYMFSPKVLDRANTFEFRVEAEDLAEASRPREIDSAEPNFGAGLLAAAGIVDLEVDERFSSWMVAVHRLLSEFDREFGHRTFQEATRFASLLKLAGEGDPLVALDLQISQKVLPRLHGSRRELGQLLNRLAGLCALGPDVTVPDGFDLLAETLGEEVQLPVSYSKLRRMARRLADRHFVSFAE